MKRICEICNKEYDDKWFINKDLNICVDCNDQIFHDAIPDRHYKYMLGFVVVCFAATLGLILLTESLFK